VYLFIFFMFVGGAAFVYYKFQKINAESSSLNESPSSSSFHESSLQAELEVRMLWLVPLLIF